MWNLGISFKINSMKEKRPEGEEGGEAGDDAGGDDNSFEGGDF
jgi:hypothetical protein